MNNSTNSPSAIERAVGERTALMKQIITQEISEDDFVKGNASFQYPKFNKENLLQQLLKVSKHCKPDTLIPDEVIDFVIPAVGYRLMDMSNLTEIIKLMHNCSNSSTMGTIITQEEVSLREGAVSHLSIICTGCQEGVISGTSNKSSSTTWDINRRIKLLSKELHLEEKDVQKILEILGIFYRPVPVINDLKINNITQEKKTNISSTLNKKINFEDNDKKYECEHCFKSFPLKNHLKSHSYVHNETLHICPYCKAYFKKSYNLREHVKKHSNQKYKCKICNKQYTDKSTLNFHIKAIHHNSIPRFTCEDCKKQFIKKCHFKEHQRSHTNEKPYECEKCNKKFSYSSSLKKHMLVHFTNAKFKCRLCGKFFKWMIELRKHLTNQHHLSNCDLEAHMFTDATIEELPADSTMMNSKTTFNVIHF